MPRTCSADPDSLFRFVRAVDHLDVGLISEPAALGAALDHAQRTCVAYCGPLPRLDGDLADLLRAIDDTLARFIEAGLRFIGADCDALWPGFCEPAEPVVLDPWRRAARDGAPPPLATLVLLAGDRSLDDADLRDIGHALLGLARSAKPLADIVGAVASARSVLLSSPRGRRLAARLAETPAASRVLRRLPGLSGTPLSGVAQRGLSALTLFEDARRLQRDGKPLQAWRRKGAAYVADVAGAGFDVTSTACSSAPNPYTCGGAAVSGTVWVAAQAWEHRAGIAHGTDLASRSVMNELRRVRRLASSALGEGGPAKQELIDAIRNADRNPGLVRLPTTVTHAIADTIEGTSDLAHDAARETGELLSKGVQWLHR